MAMRLPMPPDWQLFMMVGGQTSPKTYFAARGLISHDQDELYDITQYLSTEGNSGISENNTSPEALLSAVRNPKLKTLESDLFVLHRGYDWKIWGNFQTWKLGYCQGRQQTQRLSKSGL